MRPTAFALVLAAMGVYAQNLSTSDTAATGSIKGIVRDPGTGTPIADATVSVYINSRFVNGTIFMSAETKEVKVLTDAQGHYDLAGLPAAQYWISARSSSPDGGSAEKVASLRAGQNLSGIDFSLPARGTIVGRVFDQNDEPMNGVSVLLLSKEYSMGAVAYLVRQSSKTNDEGEYILHGVDPGRSFLLLANKRTIGQIESEEPTDTKLRKAAFVPTYFPNSPLSDGAESIFLRAGERREGIDIHMLRTQSYCAEGTVITTIGPMATLLDVSGQEIGEGLASGGGQTGGLPGPGGTTGPDGNFRVCGLRPGSYRFRAWYSRAAHPEAPPEFAETAVTIMDRDLTKLQIALLPGLPVPGVVVWDQAPPDRPLAATVSISLAPLSVVLYQGEPQHFVRTSIPGEFSFPSVLLRDYSVSASLNAPGVYVKDIFYGLKSVMHESLRPGTATGNGELRIVMAHDGGSIAVRVADKDGNPVPDITVAIIPAELPAEALLPENLISGETDQGGNYSYAVLAPGKYLVFATNLKVDHLVETVAKLWGARSKATPVEIAPNGSNQLTLTPLELE